MDNERSSVILVNLRNGARGEVEVHEDGELGGTYIEHCDLLAWAEDTGCEDLVQEMWSSKSDVKPFIGFEDDGISSELAIYKNTHGEEYCLVQDRVAFMAKRITTRTDYGENPNRIPRKGKVNV